MKTFMFVDTETGGLNPITNSLLEIGCVFATYDEKVKQFDEVGHYHTMTRPDDGVFAVTAAALRVNGISLTDPSHSFITYGQASDTLEVIVRHHWELNKAERLVVAGWNTAFDMGFIQKQLHIDKWWSSMVSYRLLDVQALYQALVLAGRLPSLRQASLVNVSNALNLPYDGAHRAMHDARQTMRVMEAMLKLL